MYKSRNFLIGIGFGFIICGVVLVIYSGGFITLDSIFDNTRSNNITDEELIKLAQENGLFVYTKGELDELINKSILNYNDSLDNNNINSNDESKIDTEEKNKIEENAINFYISYGMDSFQVAEYLYSIGALHDKQLFHEILNNNNLTKKIITGEYEANNISVEELIELITKTNIR